MRTLRDTLIMMIICFFFLIGCAFVTDVDAAEAVDPSEIVEPLEPEDLIVATAAKDTVPEVIDLSTVTTEEITEDMTDEITDVDTEEAIEEVPDLEEPSDDEADETIQVRLVSPFLTRMEAVDILSRLIQTEGGDTFEDKVCVALTVLHRVDSDEYPDSIEENIYKPGQYATPSDDWILDINLAAAEYAVRLWESGMSYEILPETFLYFGGDGHKNHFHDFHGHHHKLPKIEIPPEMVEELIKPYSEGAV